MGLLDRFLEKKTKEITQTVTQELVKHVDASIQKGYTGENPYMTGSSSTGVKRYQFSQDMVNGGIQRKKKPGSNISFETLRAFSVNHEISRACINFRKRQISGLEWDIVTADKNDTSINESQRAEIKQFFRNLGGRGIGYREFMNRFIEDLMVLDAVSLEKQKNRGGGLFNLIPIDAATIRLRVDESGAIPEPPEAAYVQVIRGQVTASFTDDEMLYKIMNPRNDTPYGLAPLESLLLVVNSSLKAGMYNLGYLSDGNIPEGLFTLPETWQPNQIKEFQEYFDALMAGDDSMTRRIKFMPQGTYTPTKKPDDMAFQEFNDWLMKVTCALFEINPIDIGFSPKSGLGGAGFAQQQEEGSEDKGKRPLALFIEEIFTKVVQEDLGFPNLKFDFPELRQKDAKAVAEVNQIYINSGQRTIDEVRTDEGLQPLPDGMGARAFVSGQVTFLDEESLNGQANGQQTPEDQLQHSAEETAGQQNPQEDAKNQDEAAQRTNKADTKNDFQRVLDLREEQIKELRTFRKYATNRHKAGKSIRPFVSEVLPLAMTEELNSHVEKADDLSELRKAFEEPIRELELANVDTALEARNKLLNLA